MDRDTFVATIGWVFEHSPWVAERAWEKRPFADLHALHEAMRAEVETAGAELQVALLRTHPDLGTKARISQASTSEQADAGVTTLSAELIDRYREKFGFPFIFAVKGSSKHDILRALEQRLSSTRDEEFAEALRQVYRIAWFRLAG